MKPVTSMKSPCDPPADTARRAVFWERAFAKSRKTGHSSANPVRQPAHALKPASPRPPVRRTAVRFASQPPHHTRKGGATFSSARKSLILNHKFKAQSA
jgi:hypothetical protein